MHPKILTALTLAVLGSVVTHVGAAHAAPTNPTPARAATQTTNQTAPTLLQQNLLTLIKAGQAMEAETQVKQAEIEKKYQPKVAEAKTDAQKAAIQTQFLNEVIAYKSYQKQKFAAIKLTEPSVSNLRDQYIETLSSDIAAAQIVIANPKPTPDSKKKFAEQLTKSKNLTLAVRNGLETLMKKAGFKKQVLQPKTK
ncbi:hypothetical protein HG532_08210 [Moraxella osloensis]|nr:hypothetical protein [Moraxella osloensis]MBW4010006.1 hypothetical protein [Moraxella osloensis]